MNKEKQLFQIPACIEKISTLTDGTLKLSVYCSRELQPEQMQKVFALNRKEGWLAFSKNTLQMSDIPQETAKMDKDRKSASQRLYAVLFVEWKQSNSEMNFEEYRQIKMERIIDSVKSNLR